MNSANRFISLEGSEGCGKSTQLERLRAKLEAAGHSVTTVREPGGTPLGEALRHLVKHAPEGRQTEPEAELLLFTAARAQLARTVIAPALAAGHWVLADRYGDSTIVYQGHARRLPLASVEAINAFAMGPVKPSLTLVLEVDPRESLRRLQRRPRPAGLPDRFELLEEEFFERVREGYRLLARTEPDRVKLINAEGSLEDVEAEIWKEVTHAFKP